MPENRNPDGMVWPPSLSESVDRAKQDKALLTTGALQDAIFNSPNFSSIATDANGVIQIFNVGAERMLGYAAADVVNRITPADISDPRGLIARAGALSLEFGTPIAPGLEALVFKASRGIEDIYELDYIRMDGSRLPAAVSVTALRDAGKSIIGYLLIGTDNTARKQVEAERSQLMHRQEDLNRQLQQANHTLQISEEKLKVTLHSIGDAVIATDVDALVTLLNPQAEKLTGWTLARAIGRPVGEMFHVINKENRRPSAIPVIETLANGTVQGLANHTVLIAADGSECDIADSCAPIRDRANQVIGAVLVFRDVTGEYAAQQALRESNVALKAAKSAAERANLAKSDFLSSMSHELRSPLNAILGFSQLIDSGLPPPTPAQKESIDQILQAGWYLLELINEILDLSLIESGKLSLSLESMSLSEVLDDCQAMIHPQARDCGIRIRFPAPDGPQFVHADRTRVKQVVINLLSNAIKYNRPGGAVEVSFDYQDAGRVRLSFRDTGQGLSAQHLAQLFQPFNRLGQENGDQEGTGIGLVVCKRLVELMGGTIGVESAVGVGSVFWFELAAAGSPGGVTTGDAAGRAMPAHALAQAPMRSVLCVEDNPANLLLIEKLLARRPDIRLLTATDGTQGVARARLARPDAILMDINLPGISGIEALRLMLADPATACIPVIALSANAMPRDIEKGLAAGFFRYLTKPIKVDELMGALGQALDHTGPPMRLSGSNTGTP